MELAPRPWTPPIVRTIATQNQGLEDLWMRIQQHRQYLEHSGRFEERRRERLVREIVEIAEQRLREHVLAPRTETPEFNGMLERVVARQMDPYEVAEKIVPRSVVALGRPSGHPSGE
jgi:LAO/AO transport system kinase